MKRMTDKMAQQMLTFFADRLDINNLPPDIVATFELFQRADTDGILMMESDWDINMTFDRLSLRIWTN